MIVMVTVIGSLLGWSHVPGLLGEWLGSMIGIMTTPFFMEGSFLVLGLVIVIALNTWRRHKEGDDCVYLEQVTGPNVPRDLPDQVKWAVYREKPLDGSGPTPLELAEGALEIGDFEAAAKWLGTLEENELNHPETLEVRLKLANATGLTDLASSLEIKIRDRKP